MTGLSARAFQAARGKSDTDASCREVVCQHREEIAENPNIDCVNTNFSSNSFFSDGSANKSGKVPRCLIKRSDSCFVDHREQWQ